MSETDEKLQKGIIELDKGNDKKAFNYFKDVYEGRKEKLLKKVSDNPKSPTLMLDALETIHAIVWLRVAQAGKEKKHNIELFGKAVGAVEAARTALLPLVNGLAQWANEKNIVQVKNRAKALIDATRDLEDMANNYLDASRKMA
ncbi:hypothetical protein EU545_01840 [Candidatus Thorarchaeota archaeon]|jgi:hypothetical protein|nr:MAG: hypothetical protein EU545_01840 [Candidatus Thorarchaeota archaeon]